jgi:glyoxylase-like metal-dependent hydrolase (beta-lactamase superfamily II)
MKFTVMHTPGHTPGCICLYNEEEKLMLTGDTLFAGAYGRTDFKYGSGAELMRSLRRLLSMEDEIVFYSGHGEMSRIGWEKV